MGLLPRTLRDRLTVVFAAAAALLVCLSGALLYAVLSAQLDAALNEGLERRVAALSTAVLAGDPRVPAQDPYSQIIGIRGRVLAASPAAPAQSLLSDGELALARSIEAGISIERQVPGFGDRARLLARNVTGTDLVVVAGSPVDAVASARDRVLGVLTVAGLVVVTTTTIGVRLLVGQALRPVGEMTREASDITTAEANRRLPQPPGADELADLARTLNAMLGRLEVAFARERAFVDDASHELRTPITVLRGELELGLASDDPAEMRQALTAALAEAERLGGLAGDLLVLARERSGGDVPLRRERLDLREVAEEAALRFSRGQGMGVEVVGDPVLVTADRTRLGQVASNLLSNAAQAGAHRARVVVSDHGGWAALEVHDDGPGFPPDLLPTAFERFTRGDTARTRTGRGGAGLGLAIVSAIVRAHGGQAKAANGSDLGGARVAVLLPRPGAGSADATPAPRGG